jgi:hypothetical protein
MISLCPGCHAKVGREQHPLGHEQNALDFKANFPAAKSTPLFREIAPQEATPTKPLSKALENTLIEV